VAKVGFLAAAISLWIWFVWTRLMPPRGRRGG
jgi:hypothetical protein